VVQKKYCVGLKNPTPIKRKINFENLYGNKRSITPTKTTEADRPTTTRSTTSASTTNNLRLQKQQKLRQRHQQTSSSHKYSSGKQQLNKDIF